MKAPTSLFDRSGRTTAVVGAVVAVSATAAAVLLSGVATAEPSATQPGKCTKNVNVRAEPNTESRIVALCEQGTAVQVAESRDGFLRLSNLGGWAAQEYVSVNGRAPAASQRSEGDDDEDGRRSSRSGTSGRGSGSSSGGSGSESGDSESRGSDSRGSDSRSSGAQSAEESDEESATDEAGAEDGTETGAEDGAGDDAGESGESDEPEADDADADAAPAGPRSRGLGGLIG